ncbi:MAG: thioesterase family protein [Bacteroidales bacterium]|nr:thioesterase family protein [Bacteroidales bacterium]
MEYNLQPGLKGTQMITVGASDTASHYGSGLIEVFATPAMVALMEKTAQLSVQEHLPEGHITLGTEISVSHVKATPVGSNVVCESHLVSVDGKKLLFKVSAHDEKGLIGEGTHRRYIVEASKFMEKLKQVQ